MCDITQDFKFILIKMDFCGMDISQKGNNLHIRFDWNYINLAGIIEFIKFYQNYKILAGIIYIILARIMNFNFGKISDFISDFKF